MINTSQPFKVPVLIPSTKRLLEALLVCLFEDGEAIVMIEGTRYHCIINENQFLELSNHADEKRIQLSAIEGIRTTEWVRSTLTIGPHFGQRGKTQL